MNQLLFRVFDNKFKRMSLPFSFKDITGKWGCIDFRDDRGLYGLSWEGIEEEPDRFIIMQFTGLTTLYDDPAKIFDHDFVKIYFANKSIICLVKWDYDDGGYRFEEVNGDEYYIYSELIHYDDFEKIEILGNVHEHKHLLEAADGN
jgi:hypothetical protein